MSEIGKTQATADYDRAIDKIRDEMAGSKTKYTWVVGEYLTEWLGKHREDAGKILAENKTIAGSMAAMRDEARKTATGGVGILDDETAFGIVLKYFGVEKESLRSQTETSGEDDLSLDALLGVM